MHFASIPSLRAAFRVLGMGLILLSATPLTASATQILSGKKMNTHISLEIIAHCSDSTFELEPGMCTYAIPSSCKFELKEVLAKPRAAANPNCQRQGVRRTIQIPLTQAEGNSSELSLRQKRDGSVVVIHGSDSSNFRFDFPGDESNFSIDTGSNPGKFRIQPYSVEGEPQRNQRSAQ